MGSHPLNLAIRFLLEIATLIAAGKWGWEQGDGWIQYLFAIGIPIGLAAIWGTFNVPKDQSRSGKAPVVTPGLIRLILELSFFAFGTWALYDLGMNQLALIVSIIVMVHYIISYDRIKWLLSQKEKN